MPFNRDIGAPFVLASLPHAISQKSGRTHATCVCTIAGTKKRKRTEIAVALDGEGISIYSLRNPFLATSYALPPQTTFSSAPCSIYRKGTSPGHPHRYTYAFVTDDAPDARPHLVCFAEETLPDATTKIVKYTYTPSVPCQSPVAIDVVPVAAGGTQKDATHDVVVVFESGETICLSANLEVVRWLTNIQLLGQTQKDDFHVEHVSLSTARTVTHGLLKNRQDISTILSPSLNNKSDMLDLTYVLCTISRCAGKRRILGLFQLHPRSPDLPSNSLPTPKHLLTWDIPPSPIESTAETRPTHSLHAKTGALHSLVDGVILSYDFSTTVPLLTSVLPKAAHHTESFLRLSQDLLLTASTRDCQIMDSKYRSVQAALSLETVAAQETRKRKHAELKPAGESFPPDLISYYSDLGQAVGVWKNEVVSFQLGGSITRKRQKTEGTRLIDSLGKGIGSKVMPSEKEAEGQRRWQKKVPKLDKYASKGAIAKFEELLASEIGITIEPATNQDNGNAHHETSDAEIGGAAVNGDARPENALEDTPRQWRLERCTQNTQTPKDRYYASYALSRIFRWIGSPSIEGPRGCLGIDFFPPNVFQWLLHMGYVTKESIRRAILDHSLENSDMTICPQDGDIVRAIVDFDPALLILSATLNQSHFLPIGEVVQAIKLLMEGLDDQPEDNAKPPPKLLTDGPETMNAMDVDVASELEAASHEMDRLVAMFDNGILIRSNTLRPALIRLHAFPASVVSTTLRSMLRRHELESLVRLLHHEFNNGGWASQHDNAESGKLSVTNPEESDDSAVAVIASLLSCTIDAIGPATWITGIGGQAEDSSTENLIHDLSQATSTAITGFWEARYIQGLLTEMLRYASKIPQSQKPSNQILQRQGKPITLDSKPDELPMLPMGSKPDLGVEKRKVGKDGKTKERSAREMGMLISRRVPKYSFERIAV